MSETIFDEISEETAAALYDAASEAMSEHGEGQNLNPNGLKIWDAKPKANGSTDARFMHWYTFTGQGAIESFLSLERREDGSILVDGNARVSEHTIEMNVGAQLARNAMVQLGALAARNKVEAPAPVQE